MAGQTLPGSKHAALQQTAVILPARNEQEAIGRVLQDLPPTSVTIVVDNGSTDATGRVAEEMGATVVREPVPGYGQACLSGLAYLDRAWPLRQPESPTIVAFLDADYSDDPRCLTDLVSPIADGQFDFVLGSRLMGDAEPGSMPLQSRLGNRLAVALIAWFWGVRYTDLGPFRAIRRTSLQSLEMSDRNYGWTVEMQIKAAVAGLRMHEISLPYRRRIGQSKISGTVRGTLLAGAKILCTIARYHWLMRGWQPGAVDKIQSADGPGKINARRERPTG
ncbi:MAG: glycosyltransferase family 2 protein [Planctomycetota bacterium]|nr:MAG: glycosyltransferase family 2 protein [Planctomycetota bacterium]